MLHTGGRKSLAGPWLSKEEGAEPSWWGWGAPAPSPSDASSHRACASQRAEVVRVALAGEDGPSSWRPLLWFRSNRPLAAGSVCRLPGISCPSAGPVPTAASGTLRSSPCSPALGCSSCPSSPGHPQCRLLPTSRAEHNITMTKPVLAGHSGHLSQG